MKMTPLKKWLSETGTKSWELAVQVGCNPVTIEKIAAGKQTPRTTTAKVISEKTGIPMESLLPKQIFRRAC